MSSFAPLALASRPTPVERLDALSSASGLDVFVKRDDQTHELYGGNKVRKLEWVLREAQLRGATDIVTAGGTGSHHVLTTAVFAEPLGISVYAKLIRQPPNPYVVAQLDQIRDRLSSVRVCRNEAHLAFEMGRQMIALRAKGRRPMWVPPGASDAVGTAGFVDAGLEFARQVEQGTVPEVDAIYVPIGSGGTAVGLAIGLSLSGLRTKVIAVRVASRLTTHELYLRRLAKTTVAWLQKLDASIPDVAIDAVSRIRVLHSFAGAEYGSPTRAGTEARRQALSDKLALDPTYTSKSAAALLAHAPKRFDRALLWHTSPAHHLP